MTTVRLVLASASPARRRVLLDAGIDPLVLVSQVDEGALTQALGPMPPAELALTLARAKAEDVRGRTMDLDGSVVIGCDSIFELDGVPYGKPLTAEVATDRIQGMSGRTGLLHTGHWAIAPRGAAGATVTTSITFAEMTTAEIDAYVASGEPLNVAGSFTLDGRSAAFITHMAGDPSNVIGISLPYLRRLLGDLGLTWTDLWTNP